MSVEVSVEGAERLLSFSHSVVKSLGEVTAWNVIGRGILTPRVAEELNWTASPLSVVERAVAACYSAQTIKGRRTEARMALSGIGRDMSHTTRRGFEEGLMVPTDECVPKSSVPEECVTYMDLISQGLTHEIIAKQMGLTSDKQIRELAATTIEVTGAINRPHLVRIGFQSGLLRPIIHPSGL